MASPTWWTWVWVNSGSWWWTGRPGVLRFMGSQRVGHDWATELTDWHLGQQWSSLKSVVPSFLLTLLQDLIGTLVSLLLSMRLESNATWLMRFKEAIGSVPLFCFLIYLFFNWRITALQNFVVFCHALVPLSLSRTYFRKPKDLLYSTGNSAHVMWQPGWEQSLGENGYMYIYMYICWVLLLSTWNCHNIVNQLI